MLLASLQQQYSGQVGQLPDTTNTEENGEDEEGQEEEENEIEEDDMANNEG